MTYCLLVLFSLLISPNCEGWGTEGALNNTSEQMALDAFFKEGIIDDLKKDSLVTYVFESDLKRATYYISDCTVGITRIGSLRHRINNGPLFYSDYLSRVDNVKNVKLNSTSLYSTLKCEEYYDDSFEGSGHFVSVKNHVSDGTNFVVQLAISHRLNVESELKVFIILDAEMNFKKYYRKVSSTPSRRFQQCDR